MCLALQIYVGLGVQLYSNRNEIFANKIFIHNVIDKTYRANSLYKYTLARTVTIIMAQ